MKVIIAGSRDIGYKDSNVVPEHYELLEETITKSKFNITEVVSGMAKGVDTLGVQWANANKILFTPFHPEWEVYKDLAGLKRNEEMGNYAEALIYLHDGNSPGTDHMIKYAREKGLKIFGYNFKKKEFIEG